MALKFLNKKGWHTGSLRNIENVWKAEQKHEAEQRKLEELRKQIQDEREKDELRHLSEQGGFAPRQERLDFLYESGLAVGKGNSDGFKALQAPPAVASSASTAEASSSKADVLGALFEDKPQSANDAWRKLHSDPLLLIRQREQEALARIKNNPIKMAMIKKSAETEKDKKHDKEKRGKKRHKSHRHSKSKSEKHSLRHHSDSDDTQEDQEEKRREHQIPMKNEVKSKHSQWLSRNNSDAEDANEDAERKRKTDHLASGSYQHKYAQSDRHCPRYSGSRRQTESEEEDKKNHSLLEHQQQDRRRGDRHSSRVHYSKYSHQDDSTRNQSSYEHHQPDSERGMEDKHREFNKLNELPGNNRRRGMPKMSEEEREARLREMQLDAELHEEQRSKRLKKATEEDRAEAIRSGFSRGKTFLDATQKSIYGTEKGGSATIEESVRRRAYYSQGGSAAHESNAFRR